MMSWHSTIRRSTGTITAGSVAVLLLAGPTEAATIYQVNQTIVSANPTNNPLQSDSVKGTITTDGTIGVLATSNILSFDIKLIDNLKPSNNYELTPSTGAIDINTDGGLSASATGLSFDFSGTKILLFQAFVPGFGTGQRYLCYSGFLGTCFAGETISPAYVFTDAVVLTGALTPVGMQPLDQTPVPVVTPGSVGVPEPGTITLLAVGLFAIASLRRRTMG